MKKTILLTVALTLSAISSQAGIISLNVTGSVYRCEDNNNYFGENRNYIGEPVNYKFIYNTNQKGWFFSLDSVYIVKDFKNDSESRHYIFDDFYGKYVLPDSQFDNSDYNLGFYEEDRYTLFLTGGNDWHLVEIYATTFSPWRVGTIMLGYESVFSYDFSSNYQIWSNLEITNISIHVPEPSTILMLLLGAIILGIAGTIRLTARYN